MKKVSAAPRNHAVRVPGRGRQSGILHDPPLPSRGMTKSRNCGPCSTSCSAACKRTRVCCVGFLIVIRLWPFEPPPLPQSAVGGLRRVQEKARKGQASIDVDASRASTVRSATPPGIWFCGSSQSSRGRSSPTQRRSHGLGEMSSCCSCPMPMRVPCSAGLRRSGKPARNGCLSMPIGMCVSASASGAIGLRCRHYRHV